VTRRVELYIDDICEAVERIASYTGNLSRDEFMNDVRTIDAVIRNLEILGEAAKHIPVEVRSKFTGIDWKGIAECATSSYMSTLVWISTLSGTSSHIESQSSYKWSQFSAKRIQ